MDRDGLNAVGATCADDAESDFASVGDEDLAKGGPAPVPSALGGVGRRGLG